MEEENNNKFDTDELFKETSNTFNEVKDQVKESFKKEEFKNSATETKNFIVEMFKNPIEGLKNIANDDGNSNFKYAIILVVIWMAAILIYRVVYNIHYSIKFSSAILSVVKATIAPVVTVCAISIVVMIMNKNKGKSLVTILSVVIATKLPIVIANVVNLLRLISYKIINITSPFYALCEIISAVLLYFGIKFLYNEENDEVYIKKFVIVEAIYIVVAIVIGLLDVVIY